MQLKALAGLQAQREALDSRRHGQADTFYKDGLAAFSRASNSDFKDRAALQQALEAWVQAIRHQRGNPEPCIALGYLFTILGDSRTAVMYLKTAQRLDPKHPDPPKLLEHLVSASRPAAKAEADDDELIEAFQDWMKRLAGWPPPVVSPDPLRIQTLESCRSQLALGLHQLQHQLNALDAEIDVSQLRTRLQPLEQRLHQYVAALEASQTFSRLNTEIETLAATVERGMSQGIDPAGLEAVLDRCDWLADRLDELDKSGHDIRPLESAYGKLCQRVEALQDRVDEG